MPGRSCSRADVSARLYPMTYSFTAEVWEWTSKASWFFVSLPEDEADDIEERHSRRAGGFGSIRVEVTIGSSTWRTSLFPSNEEKTYVLPLKKAVRTAEGLGPGSTATVELVVVTD
jgi:hypothetical protein